MRLVAGVRTHLLALPAISALVSTRIFELIAPEKVTPPYVVLMRVSDPSLDSHLRGPGFLSRARLQVDCWAKTPDAASALGTLCRQRLDAFAGVWSSGGSPVETITVQGIRQDDERDIFEEEILGGICRHSADYFVTYRPSGEEILAFV